MRKLIITEGQAKEILGGRFLRESKSVLDIFNVKRTPLLEAYYATYPIKKVVEYLTKHFYLSQDYQNFLNNSEKYQGFITITEMESGEESISLVFPNGEYPLKKLGEAMSLCGYYESDRKKIGEIGGVEYVNINFEKRHQDNVSEKIKGEYKYLYHITLKEKEDKIRRIGLVPKAYNKRSNHPERVYLIPSNSPIPYLMFHFYQVGKMLYPDKNSFIVCGIETKDLDCEFHFDPNMESAVYITENISPQILHIKDIIVKNQA